MPGAKCSWIFSAVWESNPWQLCAAGAICSTILIMNRVKVPDMNNRNVPHMKHTDDQAQALLRSRNEFRPQGEWLREPMEAEGGCGVTGFACTIPVGGKHIYEPSKQMRNRGNGKGGGIAACGLVAADLGVTPAILKEDYIIQVALLDPDARGEVERKYVEPFFDIDHGGIIRSEEHTSELQSR